MALTIGQDRRIQYSVIENAKVNSGIPGACHKNSNKKFIHTCVFIYI